MRKKLFKRGFVGFALASTLMISTMTVMASELPVETVEEIGAVQIQTDEAVEESDGTLTETEDNVKEGLYDKTVPVVKNVTLQSTKVSYSEQIVLSAEIADDLSGVSSCTIVFENKESGTILPISLEEHQGDIYTGKVDIDKTIVSGTYSFLYISVSDNVNNSYLLYANIDYDKDIWGSEYVSPDYLQDLQIVVANDYYESTEEQPSENIPVLNSIKIGGNSNVIAPGIVEVTVDVSNVNEITAFAVWFGTDYSNVFPVFFSNTYTDYFTGEKITYSDGKLHAEIAIDEHLCSGVYEVKDIEYTTKNGYSYRGSYPDRDRYIADEHIVSFTVQGADVVCDENVINFPAESPTVSIYTSDGYTAKSLYNFTKNTKEILNDIKGTNKNCIFTDKKLSYCNNSIQLIFKGKEMTGEPRDIDLNVEKYVLSQSKTAQANAIREQVGDTPAYVLDFSDKGEFPGNITVRFRDVKNNSYRSLREYLGTEGLCLYEYKDGAVNLVAENLSIAKDNYYEFTVDHGATYVVTGGKVAEKQDNQPENDTTAAEKQGEEFATNEGNTFTQDETGAVRCYDEATGEPVIDDFKCDGTYTYYFQADGTAMQDRLTYHPDGVHVIYFDENGHEVFSNFANVKKTIAGEAVDDYCFFDVHGYLYVDVVTYDQAGKELYYANPYGVLERGKWFQFSNDVMCADGTPWNGAAGNYGYANADGTLMVNQYTYDWEGRYCYMQGNGVAKYD